MFVSCSELTAIIPSEAIRDVGMYLVTVKSRGEPIAQFYPALFVLGGAAPRPRSLSCETRHAIAPGTRGRESHQDCRTAMKDAVTPAGPPSCGLARRTDPTSD